MERHVIGFLRASLLWLGAGVTLGVVMAMRPALTAYRPAHLHMLLLGFVTMMIAGVSYHVLPRFAATSLHSVQLAQVHFVLANLGLALLASGFIARVHGASLAPVMLGVGGTLSAAGAYCFAFNLWRTLDRAAVASHRLAPLKPIRVL